VGEEAAEPDRRKTSVALKHPPSENMSVQAKSKLTTTSTTTTAPPLDVNALEVSGGSASKNATTDGELSPSEQAIPIEQSSIASSSKVPARAADEAQPKVAQHPDSDADRLQHEAESGSADAKYQLGMCIKMEQM
jgi:hypothetical protein